MADFSESVDAFLNFRRYQILQGKGSISSEQAKAKAHTEYQLFNPTQRIDSDFDKELRKLNRKRKNNDHEEV